MTYTASQEMQFVEMGTWLENAFPILCHNDIIATAQIMIHFFLYTTGIYKFSFWDAAHYKKKTW
jgi:hypothetical protein